MKLRSSRLALINTPFQRGEGEHAGRVNRLKRFTLTATCAGTPLKRGVNEIRLSRVSLENIHNKT